jgi:hypothetical protein
MHSLLVPPLEPNLQVMIRRHNLLNLRQQLLTLIRVQLVDALRKWAQSKYALPPSHRVRPHNRMHTAKVAPYVLRRPARSLMNTDLLRVRSSGFEKPVPAEYRRKPLEKLLVRRAKTIIKFIPTRPERITTCRHTSFISWQLHEAQRRVVCGRRLELNVRVPLCGVVLALVFLEGVREDLLAC